MRVLDKIPKGKEFMETVERATRLIDELYGKPKIPREERIEDLIT